MNALPLAGLGSIELLIIMLVTLSGSAGPNAKPDARLDTSAAALLSRDAPDLPASTLAFVTVDGDFVRNAYHKIGQAQPGWNSQALDQALSDLVRARVGVDLTKAASVSVVFCETPRFTDSVALVFDGDLGAPPQAALSATLGARKVYTTPISDLALFQLPGSRVLLTTASPDNPWRTLGQDSSPAFQDTRGEQLMRNTLKRVPASPITLAVQASGPFLSELRGAPSQDLPIPQALALSIGNARPSKLALHDDPERLQKLAAGLKNLRKLAHTKLQAELEQLDQADFFAGLTLVAASQLIDPFFDTLVVRQDHDILTADVPDIALAFAGAGGVFAGAMLPMMLLD